MDILDLLLLPKTLYKRITDRKLTLYIGTVIVGVIDLALPLITRFSGIFSGKAAPTMVFNIPMAILLIILTGLIDVVFFSIPVYDICKFLKRDKNVHNGSQLIKLMKVYILSNIVILPVSVIYVIAAKSIGSNYLEYFYYLQIFIAIWMSAVIARGINVIYEFSMILKRIIFIIIFTWSYILSDVNYYIINYWFMRLFQ